jgi:hypothetical protein
MMPLWTDRAGVDGCGAPIPIFTHRAGVGRHAANARTRSIA